MRRTCYASAMKTPLIALAAGTVLAATALVLSAPSAAQQQPPAATPPSGTTAPQPQFVWPARIANARVLPAEIGAERLRATMVGFARSLGVRCTYCHVGPEGAPLTSLDFVSDANPRKEIARGMIRLVRRINAEDLPAMIGPPEEQQRVTCFTCHRGASTPASALPPPAQQ